MQTYAREKDSVPKPSFVIGKHTEVSKQMALYKARKMVSCTRSHFLFVKVGLVLSLIAFLHLDAQTAAEASSANKVANNLYQTNHGNKAEEALHRFLGEEEKSYGADEPVKLAHKLLEQEAQASKSAESYYEQARREEEKKDNAILTISEEEAVGSLGEKQETRKQGRTVDDSARRGLLRGRVLGSRIPGGAPIPLSTSIPEPYHVLPVSETGNIRSYSTNPYYPFPVYAQPARMPYFGYHREISPESVAEGDRFQYGPAVAYDGAPGRHAEESRVPERNLLLGQDAANLLGTLKHERSNPMFAGRSFGGQGSIYRLRDSWAVNSLQFYKDKQRFQPYKSSDSYTGYGHDI